jgi:predicted nucleic acid-binding protein
MIATADASFLVSLYGVDVNTPAARGWMAANAEPVLLTGALRFETENALRLACFRGRITAAELAQALAEIESDLATGILIATDIAADVHWAECRSISAAHTLSTGSRAYDITHVAAARLLKADTFLSFDGKQRTLAGLLGLNVAP